MPVAGWNMGPARIWYLPSLLTRVARGRHWNDEFGSMKSPFLPAPRAAATDSVFEAGIARSAAHPCVCIHTAAITALEKNAFRRYACCVGVQQCMVVGRESLHGQYVHHA